MQNKTECTECAEFTIEAGKLCEGQRPCAAFLISFIRSFIHFGKSHLLKTVFLYKNHRNLQILTVLSYSF